MIDDSSNSCDDADSDDIEYPCTLSANHNHLSSGQLSVDALFEDACIIDSYDIRMPQPVSIRVTCIHK